MASASGGGPPSTSAGTAADSAAFNSKAVAAQVDAMQLGLSELMAAYDQQLRSNMVRMNAVLAAAGTTWRHALPPPDISLGRVPRR